MKKAIKRWIYWTNKKTGNLYSQLTEYETENTVKISSYKREIPKEIIGNKNKSYYGMYYFWSFEEANDAINEYHKEEKL